MRTLSALLGVVLGLSALTACGGSSSSSSASGGDSGAASASTASAGYCTDLKATKKKLDSIEGGDLSGLATTADKIHQLRDEAPDTIQDDWTTLSDGFDKILDAFTQAGFDADDIAGLQSGKLPAGTDMQALQTAMDQIQQISGEEFTAASDAIAEHAKSECGIDLDA